MGAMLLDCTGRPLAYWSVVFDATDLERFGAIAGAPDWMAEFELYAILASLHVWQTELTKAKAGWVVQADSQAALGAALKLASPKPLVNALAAEISLQLEVLGADLVLGEHWRNALNVEADALSRLAEGKPLPDSLSHLVQSPTGDRSKWFRAWPESWAQRKLNTAGRGKRSSRLLWVRAWRWTLRAPSACPPPSRHSTHSELSSCKPRTCLTSCASRLVLCWVRAWRWMLRAPSACPPGLQHMLN